MPTTKQRVLKIAKTQVVKAIGPGQMLPVTVRLPADLVTKLREYTEKNEMDLTTVLRPAVEQAVGYTPPAGKAVVLEEAVVKDAIKKKRLTLLGGFCPLFLED